MRKWLFRLGLLVLVLVLVAAAGLAYGPLFAWSPITPGFSRTHDGRLVFLHREQNSPKRGQLASRDLAALESAAGLGLSGDVTVVVCDWWEDLERFTPWLPVLRDVGARTVEFGTVVYLTPLAKDGHDTAALLRHELMHALLLRHTPVESRAALGRHWWPVEGLAVRYGNPGAYALPEYGRMQQLLPDLATILQQEPRDGSGVTMTERYALAAGFIAYLEQAYGRDLLHAFIRGFVKSPAEWPSHFQQTFGDRFEYAVAAFGRSIEEPPGYEADAGAGPDELLDPDDPETPLEEPPPAPH